MSAYELAAYEPAQRDDYLRLLRDAWGDVALSGEEFDWWFSRNPAGSLMSVARDDGRVVGVAAHSLYRMVLGGEERLATFSVHATTDPVARGKGVFVGLERKHEEEAEARGVAVVLAFASAPTAPLFLGPLGWTSVGKCASGRGRCPVGVRRGGAARGGTLRVCGRRRGWDGRTTSCVTRRTSTGGISTRRVTTWPTAWPAAMPCSGTSATRDIRLRSLRISSGPCGRCCARALQL